jgi:hypothetical protein
MIDLYKVIKWFLVFGGIWFAMWMSHFMTMNIVRFELSNMVIPLHEPMVVPSGSEFPLPRLNGADSLAYCINMVGEMKAGTR